MSKDQKIEGARDDRAKLNAGLSQVSTFDLLQEYLKREGVDATFLGPRDELTRHVHGPAVVITDLS